MKKWLRPLALTLAAAMLLSMGALAAEAKKRGVSYGQLVASTTEWERTEIIRDYCASKRRKARRSGK